MLVKRAVEPRGEGEKGKGKGAAKKGKGEKRRIVPSDGEKEFEPPKKRARANREAVLPSTAPEPEPTDWVAFYAKQRNSTRGTKEMREQAAVIAGLEAENATLKTSCDEQATAIADLKAENAALRGSCDEQAVTIARWWSENATLQAMVNNHMQKEQQKGQTAPEHMPFHPEFLGFMRETFACEVMRTCNAQRVAAETAAADARLQTIALEAKVTQFEDENAMDVDAPAPVIAAEDPTPNTQLDAGCARGGLDYALHTGPMQRKVSIVLCTPETTTTRGLESRIKELEAECAEAKAIAARDITSPRRTACCVSDQKRKIASLEAVITLRRYM
ncbi:hypothetical protein DFH08DRAFT_395644 [Mycena albidolilacea]|uniref:Uncharacterized protein n=1 Tax=Mycena albidolilacea TaxID=1033008 RepID=A0AAD7EG99_9AGAR|nr:hypothetical protein DFH08DRAFT_395644 [Mycena albidolilacea]